MREQLHIIQESIAPFAPELVLASGILLLIVSGLFNKQNLAWFCFASVAIMVITLVLIIGDLYTDMPLFGGMIKKDSFSSFLKILMNVAGVLTCLISYNRHRLTHHIPEYFAFILTVILGSHLLAMSDHFAMVFISLELISLASYVLAGYSFTKQSSEGSLKYFLFGAVASAVMLYGLTLLYGVAGTLDFTSETFFNNLVESGSPLLMVAGVMALGGFLFKIAAAPMHPWAPDVYEAAPIPVIAFLSVTPKLAGLGAMVKFVLAINLAGQSGFEWQALLAGIAILTITVGNFSALAQKNPKRMMAYSSIAHTGFLMVGLVAFLPQGINHLVFYACIYVLMNFIVFIYLEYFANEGIETIAAFAGAGKHFTWPSIFLLLGLIALTGLPPTAGFTAKLLIFSSLWDAYELYSKPILLWLLAFGLLNTVVSLFYYLKIPYYAFLKSGNHPPKPNILTLPNLLGLILVILTLTFFFLPGLLMGWINRINFVL